jgi:hypothetical protein
MTVEFNYESVMKMFEQKRTKFLTKIGLQGENIASLNVGRDGKAHIDIGTSKNAKYFELDGKDKVLIYAPLTYDVYLERRYGIMAKTRDELIPYRAKFEAEIFG